jgi:presenilin-like A22 family membrane protease
MELQNLVPGAIMALFVEMAKMCGLPKGYEKVMVFVLAIGFGALLYWNSEWYNIVLNVLVVAAAAVASYEVVIKPVKSALDKDSNPPNVILPPTQGV